MIADHPLMGVGPNRFAALYNEYQSSYFSKNVVPVEKQQLATDTFEGFNLILQLFAEYGLLLFGIFTVWAVFLIRHLIRQKTTAPNDWLLRGCVGAVSAILVASLFSNPFHASPILVVAVILSAGINSRLRSCLSEQQPNPRITVLKFIILTGYSVFVVQFAVKRYEAEITWKRASDYASIDDFSTAAPLYEQSFPVLKNNGYFLADYGAENAIAGNNSYAIYLLNRSLRFYSTSNTHTYLGENYEYLKQWGKAEQEYKKAIYMVPSHFYVRYKLITLYGKLGHRASKEYWVNEALGRPVKIMSEETLSILDSIRALR
jgi:tetratricopeptide (TPR) repeat protein